MIQFTQGYESVLKENEELKKENDFLSNEILGLHAIVSRYNNRTYVDTILEDGEAKLTKVIAGDYGVNVEELNEVLLQLGILKSENGNISVGERYNNESLSGCVIDSQDSSELDSSNELLWTRKGRVIIHFALEKLGYVAEMDKEDEDV